MFVPSFWLLLLAMVSARLVWHRYLIVPSCFQVLWRGLNYAPINWVEAKIDLSANFSIWSQQNVGKTCMWFCMCLYVQSEQVCGAFFILNKPKKRISTYTHQHKMYVCVFTERLLSNTSWFPAGCFYAIFNIVIIATRGLFFFIWQRFRSWFFSKLAMGCIM